MLGDSGKDSYLLWPVADKERRRGQEVTYIRLPFWANKRHQHHSPGENPCRQSENIQTAHRSSCLRPRTHLVWSSNGNHCTAVASFKKAKKKIINFPIVNKRIKVKTELAFISSSSQGAGLYTVLSHTPFRGVSTVQKHPAQGSVLWDNLYSHSDNSHCCSDLIWLLIHANSVGRMTKHDLLSAMLLVMWGCTCWHQRANI